MIKKLSVGILCLINLATIISAGINMIEPWKPQVDLNITKMNSYYLSADLCLGTRRTNNNSDNFFEIPVIFTYGAGKNMETGGSLGIISAGSKTGISDLIIGIKYQFLKEGRTQNEQPGVAGELGFSIPTASYSDGLGTGSADILINWLIKKKLDVVDGYFKLGFRINGTNSDKVNFGNVLSYTIGVSYIKSKELTLSGELKGFNHFPSKSNGVNVPGSDYQELYLAPGFKYRMNNRYDFYCSLLLGLTNKSSQPGLFVGVTY